MDLGNTEDCKRLIRLDDYIDTVRTLRERLDSFANGERGRPMREAIEELADEAGIELRRI